MASYEDGWDLLRARGALPRTVNFITGPSRTGDIEQKIELGAHGPRRLHVILIDDAETSRPDTGTRRCGSGRCATSGRMARAPPPQPLPAARPPPALPAAAAAHRATAADLPPLVVDRFAGIDRASAERLKRGRHKVEARLDLHGMTQDEAHRALLAFIRAARTAGNRCVLVITGHGRIGGGVLKSAVPRWLDEPAFRPHLLAVATAQPRDGGGGALYVMLRRNATSPER